MPKLDHLSASSLSTNPRATFIAYSRFRDTIEAAALSHPAPFACVPQNLEPSTFISRFRDAVRGLLAFDYPCSVDSVTLRRWWSEVIVSPDPGNPKGVIIGPKKSVVEKAEATPSLPIEMKSFISLTPEEFDAFCLLISRGRVDGPIHVKDGGYTSSPHPNVEILQRPDRSIILL